MGPIIQAIISYIWLFAVLVFLWLIWRSSTSHIRRMEQTLVDVTLKSANAAEHAAEAAKTLAEKKRA